MKFTKKFQEIISEYQSLLFRLEKNEREKTKKEWFIDGFTTLKPGVFLFKKLRFHN